MDLHVSPFGDDANPGTAVAPLATIAEAMERVAGMNRAPQPQLPPVPSVAEAANAPNTPYPDVVTTPDDYRDTIRNHLAQLTEPVTIHLHPGIHFVEETLVLDADTGSNVHIEGPLGVGCDQRAEGSVGGGPR